jgi:hypothetical protein
MLHRRIGTTPRVLTAATLVALAALATGCAKKGKTISKVDQEAIKEHILNDLPADLTHKVDVNFEDKVHLLGWKADPEMAAPGSTVHFTLYWKRTGDLEPGFMLFTHVTSGDTKEAKGNLDCVGAIRLEKGEKCTAQLYGPSDWEKDKVITDTFDFNVPKDVTWPQFRFLVGVGRWGVKDQADVRLHIKNAEADDGTSRANVIVLPTGVKPPEPPPPTKTGLPSVIAPKYGKAEIKLDGKLDEPTWQKAGFTGPFVEPGDGRIAPPTHPVAASAKLAWDDDNLYVGFVVADKGPTSPFKATDKDPHIWEKSSAVELMIQPGNPGDNKDYYELQVDVNGAVFDTHWDDYNQPKDDAKGEFGHMDWASGLKQAVSIDKAAGNYTVEVAIPWTAFKGARTTVPPKPGEIWRMNFYSFRDNQTKALAWSAILGQGNFHKTARFGMVRFVDPTANPQTMPSGSASGMPKLMPPGAHMIPPGQRAPIPPLGATAH